jgi:hypothetical protein
VHHVAASMTVTQSRHACTTVSRQRLGLQSVPPRRGYEDVTATSPDGARRMKAPVSAFAALMLHAPLPRTVPTNHEGTSIRALGLPSFVLQVQLNSSLNIVSAR